MQLDQANRGFSFMKDGPLDMRMGQSGMSAADIVNSVDEDILANLIYLYGEERASRRIARNIVKSRENSKFETTFQLVKVIEASLPRSKPNQTHPATRTFQALRIAVNDELGQLVSGLKAAENILSEGGLLAVVTFHSLEDRIVKRFIQSRSGNNPKGNRYQPDQTDDIATFERIGRKAILASEEEIRSNPRSRSAKLRLARRLNTMSGEFSAFDIGLPKFNLGQLVL
jgi:16S rRNA (cytosine1402-N4)-methyltransferase